MQILLRLNFRRCTALFIGLFIGFLPLACSRLETSSHSLAFLSADAIVQTESLRERAVVSASTEHESESCLPTRLLSLDEAPIRELHMHLGLSEASSEQLRMKSLRR